MGWVRQCCILLACLAIITSQLLLPVDSSFDNPERWTSASSSQDASSTLQPVRLIVLNEHVVMDNGIVRVTLSRRSGKVTGIQYNGIDNLLEYRNKADQRGYWDIQWSGASGASHFDTLNDASFRIIANSEDGVEVSFIRTWNPTQGDNSVPLNIDKRFIMLQGSSGFYSYAIFEHMEGWPELTLDEARIAFKLQHKLFHYMAISDDRQRIMPDYREFRSRKTLAFKEAVLLDNPINPALKGGVDDKYQYSSDNKDSHVHGWIASDPPTGFWVITPSDEFRTGGPVKQDLTSHSGPTSLALFFSGHYAGYELGVRLQNGEAWKKVFGPVFIYLNSDSDNQPRTLWEDAKQQMLIETRNWPYDFPLSEDFLQADQRGTIRGRLLINDRYISQEQIPAKSAYIGLATPGEVGSWQRETKGYQFWNQTDDQGNFMIRSVRPGIYNLYAWVPGILGDYKYDIEIEIKAGDEKTLDDLVYIPPRDGPTLWEIGIPDRSAAEFFVPDPAPGFMNNLSINHGEKFRQYGLWDRYADLYPEEDLVYRVGESKYDEDWFFAHVNRKVGSRSYVPTTWQIAFDLGNVISAATYKLRIAIASATLCQLKVFVNDLGRRRPNLTTRHIGRDNSVARHGSHGLYWVYSIDISGSELVDGTNIIFLRLSNGGSPFNGLMYDYIRLEGPPRSELVN